MPTTCILKQQSICVKNYVTIVYTTMAPERFGHLRLKDTVLNKQINKLSSANCYSANVAFLKIISLIKLFYQLLLIVVLLNY